MTMSSVDLERVEISVSRRLLRIATVAIEEGGIDYHRFTQLTEDAYCDASWEQMRAIDAAKENKRQARKERRAVAAEQDFKLRTARQFKEFKDIFNVLMERAKRSARKRAQRDREHYGSRSTEDLIPSSFRSRMLTTMWRWRNEWQTKDVLRWLEMLGVDGREVSEIERQYRRRHRCKVYDVSEA